MALMITEACAGCDSCVDLCLNEAISAGEPIYQIDPLRCTECVGAKDEPQCQLECPAECIEPDPDWSETREQLQTKYTRLHS
jgi:ferredoxin